MKTRITILCCMLLCLAFAANAQWKFELVAGPSFTTFTGGEKKDWGGTDTNPKLVLRGSLGLRAERLLNEKLSAGGGIVFSLKGTAYQGDVEYYNTVTFDFENITVKYTKILAYIDVPLYVKYKAGDKIKLLAGLQPSFLLSAKVKNDKNARTAYPNLPEKEDAKDYYSGLDLALLLGPHYQVNEKLSVQLLVTPGILKIAKDEVYGGNGNMVNKKFKVNNAGLSLSFAYIISE
ncbi:MAG: PorT family protein [Cyclobacteriaceae bacterium]|nr:PorT family protein [Cyclobacteriaceae bacterium]